MVRQGKKATHKCSRVEGGLSGTSKLQGPVSEPVLTKAPFEPMKDTDVKHLTRKTAFLPALASGKRRSEIHAWVAKKVSNLGQGKRLPCSHLLTL